MKRKIDEIRDGPKVFQVGDIEDQTPILLMIPTPEGLYTIKQNSIYITRLADKIDPGRTNVDVPDVHQKFCPYGMNDWVVSTILGTADALFTNGFMNKYVSKELAMSKVMKMTSSLCDIQERTNQLTVAIDNIVSRGVITGGSKGQILPHTPNLREAVEVIVRRSDDVRKIMIDFLVEIYKPTESSKVKDRLKRLRESIVLRHGESHSFVEYFDQLLGKFNFLANFRNNWEHPSLEKQVVLKDFDVYPDANIHSPSIQLVDPETPQEVMDVAVFAEQMLKSLVAQCEIFMGNICSSNASFGSFDVAVVEIPQDRGRYPNVRLGYAVFLNGEWQPIS